MTSRIKRWTGVDVHDPASARSAEDPAIDLRLEQAIRTALAALEAARAKRDRSDRRRNLLVGIEAVAGVTGVAGLVGLLVTNAPQLSFSLIGLLAAAGAAPTIGSLVWLTSGRQRDVEEIAAIETARAIAVQVASLSRALEVAAKRPSETAPKAVADEMLAHFEHLAGALSGREQRVDLDQGPKARRHVRIKPANERIAVTTEDGMTVIAQLVDVSISGAMIAGEFSHLQVGDPVRIGSRAATVVRNVERGVACEFLEPLPAHTLAPNVVL